MTVNRKDIQTQEQANAFVDLHATLRGVLSGNIVKTVQFQQALADNSADIARMMIEAAAKSRRDIAQLLIDALMQRDPVALMTLAPRAAQTGLREGMACAANVLQSAQTLGKAVAADPETTTDRADRS